MDVISLWTGHRAAAFRVAHRMTIESFAAMLGVAPRTAAKWEARPDIIPTPQLQEALDTALDRAPAAVRVRFFQLLDEYGAAPGTPPAENGPDIGAMRAFRLADLQAGGGHLYPAVAAYLRDQVGPRLVSPDVTGERAVFTAAAAITEMAGWMAHDAGDDSTARSHFSRSLALVRAAGDRCVRAHVLGSMSHLEERLGQPEQAARLAQSGRDALAGGPRSPGLEARLYAMEARARAAVSDTAGCLELLAAAEGALAVPEDEAPSLWVSIFDEASLACEATRCMLRLGDIAEAERQAGRIIELRPAARARSRAFGQIMLASVLVRQGRHDEACATAAEVLGAVPAIGSHVVTQHLVDLTVSLRPHRAAAPVGDFLDQLDDGISRRRMLFRQASADAAGPVAIGASA